MKNAEGAAAVMSVLGSVLLFVLVGLSESSVTSDLKITAESGDDVTLRCEDPNISGIFLLEWTKPGLQREETMFSYRNDGVLLHQDESFKNRVSLKDPQMKDGDLSVVLKNVKINDIGTYQCRVRHVYGPQAGWKLISTISLQVSPPDLIITAELGENVILPCEDTNIKKNSVFEWIRRTDLQNKYVFLYRDSHPFLENQDECFKNRVFLKNSQMKDGDLSVVLKNVNINDTGIYHCTVLEQNDPQINLISTILLLVNPPGEEDAGGNEEGGRDVGGEEEEGLSWFRLGLIILPVLSLACFFALAVLAVYLWIYIKKTV